MGFHNEELPDRIAYGSEFGFGWKSAIHILDSGAEQRVQRRSIFQKQAEISSGLKDPIDLSVMKHFAAARRGAVHSFPVKDWSDYTTGANDVGTPGQADVLLGTGDGIETDFQLRKAYGTTLYEVFWPIKKPVDNSTIRVEINGALQVEGVDYTVDYLTGVVQFGSPPGDTLDVRAGCEFRVPMRFSEDVDELFLVKMEDFNIGEVPNIGLIEDLDPSPIDDEYDYGGADTVDLTIADVQVNLLDARCLTITAGANDLKLPNPNGTVPLPYGGIYAFIQNDSGGAINVIDHLDALVGQIPDTEARILAIMRSGGGAKAWLLT
jgi:uncharacterized protein (TIGR02217 family)